MTASEEYLKEHLIEAMRAVDELDLEDKVMYIENVREYAKLCLEEEMEVIKKEIEQEAFFAGWKALEKRWEIEGVGGAPMQAKSDYEEWISTQ